MPKTPVDKFIANFKDKGWRSDPMEHAIAIALEHPEWLADLVEQVIDQIPEGGTFFRAALSFLPLAEWPGQVQHALAALEKNSANEAAESLIAYASQQCPAALHPHLETIFALAPNGQTYYRNWPWRESGLKNFAFLNDILSKGKRTAPERIKAWECLLETRHPKALHHAMQKSRSVDLDANPFALPVRKADYFLHIGLEPLAGGFRQLYPKQVMHLAFPRSYAPDPSAPVWRRCHPTWRVRRGAATARFGGAAQGLCNTCGQPLHHLLTLDPVPKGLGVTRVARLQLVTCLSCLGWEEETLFYKHVRGAPLPIGYDGAVDYDGPFKEPEFPSGPLRKTTVGLVPADRRWRWQDWALANSRENMHRLGGHPAWIQSAAYPECVQCKRRMAFLLQLDSELPSAAGGEWLWGSGGICYCFWCDRCKISANLWQCT